jgi:thiol-disulfide isomerase/thioredoxin
VRFWVGWAVLLLPVVARAEPEVDAALETEPRFSLLSVSYELRSASVERVANVLLTPRLAISHYGTDWYLRVSPRLPPTVLPGLSPRASGEDRHRQDIRYGRIEVGTHWPHSRLMIATGLRVAGLEIDREEGSFGPRTPNGISVAGPELAAILRVPITPMDRLRIDPGIGVSASYLSGGAQMGGEARLTGIGAEAEIDFFLKVNRSLSFTFGGSIAAARFGVEQDSALAFFLRSLDTVVARAYVGFAFHDVEGFGRNDFEVRPVSDPKEVEPKVLPFSGAPELVLETLDGRDDFDFNGLPQTSSISGDRRARSKLPGQGARPWVVINFGASYCDDCREELPLYAKLAAAWPEGTFTFVTIDDTEAGREELRVATEGLPIMVLADPDLRVADRWWVRDIPQLFLVDREGRVRFHRRGFGADTLERLDAAIRAMHDADGM